MSTIRAIQMVRFMKRLFNKNVFKHRITLFTVLFSMKNKDLAESTLPLMQGWLPYSRKQKHVSFSDMFQIVTPPNGDPKGNPKGDPKGNILI